MQLIRFSRLWAYFPEGLSIAGIPVGLLDRQQAANRLLEAYSVPVELHYEDSLIQLNPSVVGFELDLQSMLAVADLERTRRPFWVSLWNYLWGSVSVQRDVPLRATFSDEQLRIFLIQEVAVRYDRPSTSPQPASGSVEFQPGFPGTALDIERSVLLIETALRSPNQRVVSLPLQRTTPTRPTFQNLEELLKGRIAQAGFDGLAGLYLLDLQTAQELSFLYLNGQTLPVGTEVAFTAGNTIRIPIMVSVFRRLEEEPDPEILALTGEMMRKSGNPPADQLIELALGDSRGPLEVTEDMNRLGLQNTFLAGFFYPGALLLDNVQTPANQQDIVNTQPSPYNQTTPSEMGMLLADIYQCAQAGGGSLTAVFGEEITPFECTQMIDYLLDSRMEVLLAGGLPEGTKIAHKNSWSTDSQGAIRDMSDAAIVYTPGGTYILAVYMMHSEQILWEPVSGLFSDLSRAVYNYYNLPQP